LVHCRLPLRSSRVTMVIRAKNSPDADFNGNWILARRLILQNAWTLWHLHLYDRQRVMQFYYEK